ncbi:MAG: uncharacterized protein A8A55_0219 [Amphiamblys sp. WSBS2006]|nr:MAG: uncharacterized protein A8A55_0219 [Amphiamblys sp. WSBS2006]
MFQGMDETGNALKEILQNIGYVDRESKRYVLSRNGLQSLCELEKAVSSDFRSGSSFLFEELDRRRILETHLCPLIEGNPQTQESHRALSLVALLTARGMDERCVRRFTRKEFLTVCFETLLVFSGRCPEKETAGSEAEKRRRRKKIYTRICILFRNILFHSTDNEKCFVIEALDEIGFFEYTAIVCGSNENPFPNTDIILLETFWLVLDGIEPGMVLDDSVYVGKENDLPRQKRHSKFGGAIEVFEGGRVADAETGESILRYSPGGVCVVRDAKDMLGDVVLDKGKRPKTTRVWKEAYRPRRRLHGSARGAVGRVVGLLLENSLPRLGRYFYRENPTVQNEEERFFVQLKGVVLDFFLQRPVRDYRCVLDVLSSENFSRTLDVIDQKNLDCVFCYERMVTALIRGLDETDGGTQQHLILVSRRILHEDNGIDRLLRVVHQSKIGKRSVLEGWFNANHSLLLLLKKLGEKDILVLIGGKDIPSNEEHYVKLKYCREKIVDRYVELMAGWRENARETNERLGQFVFFVFQCKKEILFCKLSYFLVFEDILGGSPREGKLFVSVTRILKWFFRALAKTPELCVEPLFGKSRRHWEDRARLPDEEKAQSVSAEEDIDVLENAILLEKKISGARDRLSFLFDSE